MSRCLQVGPGRLPAPGEGLRCAAAEVRQRRQELLLLESCRGKSGDGNKPVLVCWVKRTPRALGEIASVC